MKENNKKKTNSIMYLICAKIQFKKIAKVANSFMKRS